jgi:hypothetical protein
VYNVPRFHAAKHEAGHFSLHVKGVASFWLPDAPAGTAEPQLGKMEQNTKPT